MTSAKNLRVTERKVKRLKEGERQVERKGERGRGKG
jgi:hypothetical protein